MVFSLPFLLYRAVTEDRVLQAELPGYRDYARARPLAAACRAFGEAGAGVADEPASIATTSVIRIRHIMEYVH